MKAILHTQYGPPDLLQFKDLDKPAPKDNELLIKIHATTVSSGDCNIRNFTFVTKSMLPIAKLMFGIGKPWKERVLGTELAGEVEGAGKDVKRFKTGDRVVASTGMAGGGHAQYACLREKGALAIKPDSLSWEEAVAILPCIMGLADMVRILWTSFTGGKKIKGGVAINNLERMTFIAELAAEGKLKPVIDRSYPLEQIAEAFKYVEQGHKKGNVVITVECLTALEENETDEVERGMLLGPKAR